MAKYLDYSGLSHFLAKLQLLTHRHTLPTTTNKAVDTWSAGTLPTLGTAISVGSASAGTPITVGSATLGTPTSITPVTKKTVVTGGSKTSIPNVTAAGSAAAASVSNGILTLTDGVAPTLGTAIEAYTTLSTGDSVTEGTAVSVPDVTVTEVSVPNISVSSVSVPNVTSVGTAPSLTTENVKVLTDDYTGYAGI